MTLSVRIDGLDKLEKRLKHMPADLRLEQRKAVSAAGGVLKDEAARRIHSPTRHAAKGIKVRVKGLGLNMEARIVSASLAAIFSQRSRGPNKAAPPPAAALKMARRYGIPREDSYALARAIGRSGTRGRPVMADALRAQQTRVVNMFRDALISVARKVATR